MSTIEAMNVQKQLASVRVVATSNQSGTYFNGSVNNGVGATFTYATGALTIDSVAINVNDFILFAGQSAAYQNGIYQCITAGATGVAAVLQRRGDFQCIEQIVGGLYVPVAAGTSYGGSMYTVVEPLPSGIGNPVVSGANNIVFANAGVTGQGGYLALTGGTLTGPAVLDKGTGTESSHAVTINHQSGVITTTSLTTAAGATETITLTNSAITTSSVVLVSVMGGTNSGTNALYLQATAGSGTSTIKLTNGDASAALNGTVIIGFLVV